MLLSDSNVLTRVEHEACDVGTDVVAGLDFACRTADGLPAPGSGRTAHRWAVLAAAACGGLTAARILEAHADALAILGEAHAADTADPACSSGSWGVFAAESSDAQLHAEDGVVTGTKPWCSLGGVLDHALVTARVGDERQLFAVDLHAAGVRAEPPGVWVARGLPTVTSGPVHFDHVPARAIGAAGWYLRRPGFAWGGIGVAACWYGGALGVYRRMLAKARTDDIAAVQLGGVDAALHAADAVLRDAANAVDEGRAIGAAGVVLALRVRACVADAVETTLRLAGHALGPAPLAFDDDYAQRTADLALYVRQHHAERDLAALGTAVRGTQP